MPSQRKFWPRRVRLGRCLRPSTIRIDVNRCATVTPDWSEPRSESLGRDEKGPAAAQGHLTPPVLASDYSNVKFLASDSARSAALSRSICAAKTIASLLAHAPIWAFGCCLSPSIKGKRVARIAASEPDQLPGENRRRKAFKTTTGSGAISMSCKAEGDQLVAASSSLAPENGMTRANCWRGRKSA